MRYLGLLFAVLLLGADYVRGETYSIETYADMQFTNNIDQQISQSTNQTDTESGEITTGGMRVEWATDPGSDVTLEIAGSYGRRIYSSDSLDPETLKDATLNFLYNPHSSNFRLSVFDSLRQVASDRTSLQINNNLSDVNVITATPSYFIAFSKGTRLEMMYALSKVKSDQVETSRDIDSTTIGVRRLLSRGSSFSINFNETNVDFVESNEDYTVQAGFLRFDRQEGFTRFILDIGQQRAADLDDATQKLISFSLTRDINSYGELSLSYENGFVGATNVDVSNSVLGMSINEYAGFVDGLTTQEQTTLTHSYNRDQLTLGYRLYANDIESSDDSMIARTIDETRKGIVLNGGYQFSVLGGGGLNAGITLDMLYEEAEFNITDEENESKSAQIRFSYQHSMDLQLFVQILAREASNLSTRFGIDERVATVGVSYTPFRKR